MHDSFIINNVCWCRYLTTTEWSTLYGGKSANRSAAAKAEFRRLPYDHCSLSLQPFEIPYCDQHGNVFDLMSIHPFHAKFKCNPITGEKMEIKSLIKLTFHKNSEGEYHCPVMFKSFTENSHIVAIKTTGNVFSYEVGLLIVIFFLIGLPSQSVVGCWSALSCELSF